MTREVPSYVECYILEDMGCSPLLRFPVSLAFRPTRTIYFTIFLGPLLGPKMEK